MKKRKDKKDNIHFDLCIRLKIILKVYSQINIVKYFFSTLTKKILG